LYPVFDITGHHAVEEMPILGLAQGLTAGSEDFPGKTTLGNSAVPEAITAGHFGSEYRDASAISSDFESHLQSTELKH
jgi:hypothetical protein